MAQLIFPVLLLLVLLFVWHSYRVSGKGAEETKLRRIDIPREAEQAVARFAELCSLTRDKLKIMGVLRDDFFSDAMLRVTPGETDEDGAAEFSFRFDWTMVGFHVLMGYELGDGLQVDNDRVVFTTAQLCGVKVWGGIENTPATDVEQQALAECVTNAFLSRCPDAVVSDQLLSPDSVTILFKFK